jgi:hypothetical protein
MIRRLLFLLLSLLVSLVVSAVVTWLAYLRPLHDTWGVDPEETGRALPGDDLVPDATLVETRGIAIDARPEDVWPWLMQMGYGRGGWYSYDQMDNSGRSADRVMAELQDLSVGDIMPTWPGGGFKVAAMDDGRSLSLYLDSDLVKEQQRAAQTKGTAGASAGVKVAGGMGGTAMPDFRASWTFVLVPVDDGTRTRVVERLRAWTPKPSPAHKVALPMFGVGVFLMTRKQLLGLKARVERSVASGPAAQAA